jgi:hypothetical protein
MVRSVDRRFNCWSSDSSARFRSQFALNGGREAGQAALDQEVVRPGFQRGDSRILTDRAGDDDEWQIQPAGLQDLQRLGSIEGGHRKIADDQIPGL